MLTASEIPTENVLEGLCKLRIRDSVQLRTVLALYDQEIYRDEAMPSYQKFKAMIRRHIDQMIRTGNFKARNERIETDVFVKKGEKSALRGKSDNAISGEQLYGVQQETLAVSVTKEHLDEKHNRPLLL